MRLKSNMPHKLMTVRSQLMAVRDHFKKKPRLIPTLTVIELSLTKRWEMTKVSREKNLSRTKAQMRVIVKILKILLCVKSSKAC